MKKIENVVSEEYSRQLEKSVQEIEWYFRETTANDGDLGVKNQFSFSHMLLSRDVGHPEHISNHLTTFEPLIAECISKCEVSLEEYYIRRCRLGLITSLPEKVVHRPHVDFDNAVGASTALVILYYVNESDGDTYFYRGDDKNGFSEEVYYNQYKRNSLVLFNGTDWHSSSSPVNHSCRMALNINLFTKESVVNKNRPVS